MDIYTLDRTRRLLTVMEQLERGAELFSVIVEEIQKLLQSDVLLADDRGRILEKSIRTEIGKEFVRDYAPNNAVGNDLNERFLSMRSVRDNVNLATIGVVSKTEDVRCMVVPVINSRTRYGTLVFLRIGEIFSIDDNIVAAQAALILGMEFKRLSESFNEHEDSKTVAVKWSLKNLTRTELKAVRCVVEQMQGNSGYLTLTKIVKENSFSRTSLISGLNKLRSDGILEYGKSGSNCTKIQIKDGMPIRNVLRTYRE